ncbi:hypothetical protein HanIR_Chr13g0625521 [Helianthus annuus]|nr:hypothetical protein HanIR_Chr13g0625521 [Helianthus annuus]
MVFSKKVHAYYDVETSELHWNEINRKYVTVQLESTITKNIINGDSSSSGNFDIKRRGEMGALTIKELFELRRYKIVIGSSIKQTRSINTIHEKRTIGHVVVSLGLAHIDVESSGAGSLLLLLLRLLLLLLLLLLGLLLLRLLLHYSVWAHVREVVGITTRDADSGVDRGCLSRLLALRSWK